MFPARAPLCGLLVLGCASSPAAPDAATLEAGAPGDAGSTTAACLARTRSEDECKDCCDCLAGACTEIVACRDQCPKQDFSMRRDPITIAAPSVLGAEGDYSACTSLLSEQDCKACCDCGHRFACGDQRYCRDACDGRAAAWPPLDLNEVSAPVLVSAAFQFAEGPLWDGKRGVLLFSDITADSILELALPDRVTVFRRPSHQANGLGFDEKGLLLAAEHESRTVSRTLADSRVVAVAASYLGKKLNSPNDLIVRADGTIYFTDPTYGLGPRPSELGYMGLYRVAPGGALFLEARIDGTPNGVALAPGEKTLYVAATSAGRILAFDVAADGSTKNQRLLQAPVDGPDGLAVDRGGNLYIAGLSGGKGALIVLDRMGMKLGEIPLAHQPTNCGFGGSDGRTLFVTARAALYRLAVPIPGL